MLHKMWWWYFFWMMLKYLLWAQSRGIYNLHFWQEETFHDRILNWKMALEVSVIWSPQDMKAQAVLSFFFTLTPSLCGSQASFSHVSMNEQIVTGRLGEDVILPCSFESGPNVVIHWKSQDTNVYSYYKDSDQLENQDPRYVNRISLFRGEIHNGNASLSFRRLTLQDEGIYVCYVGTSLGKNHKESSTKSGSFCHTCDEVWEEHHQQFLNMQCIKCFPLANYHMESG